MEGMQLTKTTSHCIIDLKSCALQPPQPPSYEVLEHKDGSEELYINPLQE